MFFLTESNDMSALKKAVGKWLSLSISRIGASQRYGSTRLPHFGAEHCENQPGCSQDLSLHLAQGCTDGDRHISGKGPCRYTRERVTLAKGLGCWAPTSAAHFFCKYRLLTLTVLHFSISNRETVNSICPSGLYGLPVSHATSYWVCLHFKSGLQVVVLKHFTPLLF